MAATIQVLMQQDVANVGRSGDLVKVRSGFARNYLIPRQLAVPATISAVNRITHEKAVAIAKGDKVRKEARDLGEKLQTTVLSIAQRVGEDGRLFGSVTTKDIEVALHAKGLTVDRKKMHLSEPIRSIGIFEVPVKLHAEVSATIKIEVTAK